MRTKFILNFFLFLFISSFIYSQTQNKKKIAQLKNNMEVVDVSFKKFTIENRVINNIFNSKIESTTDSTELKYIFLERKLVPTNIKATFKSFRDFDSAIGVKREKNHLKIDKSDNQIPANVKFKAEKE